MAKNGTHGTRNTGIQPPWDLTIEILGTPRDDQMIKIYQRYQRWTQLDSQKSMVI